MLGPHAIYINVSLIYTFSLYYFQKRKQLVDWISGVGESLQISSATIHHCVLMMDLYTSMQQNLTSNDL